MLSLMPLNGTYATISALRVTLRELDLIPDSESLSQLKHILFSRIAELERLNNSAIGALPRKRS